MAKKFDVKELLLKDAIKAVKDYENLPNVHSEFGEPILGYVKSNNPMFDKFLDGGLCIHPKQIYRPGYTVIVHFVPFHKDIVEGNRQGKIISPSWKTAYDEAIMLSAHINGAMVSTLTELGRVSSGTNTPADWHSKIHGSAWNHKYAAYLAGMGEFSTCGSFITEKGFAGRFGSIITDMDIEPSIENDSIENFEDIIKKIRGQQQYTEAETIVPIQFEKLRACPCGAISEKGIDGFKCEEFCKTLDSGAPCPELCGKCFY